MAAWRWISWRTARSTERIELTFFVSVRVPSFSAPRGRSETFASQRRLPRSMRASEMPRARTMSRIVDTYAFAHEDRLRHDLHERNPRPVVVHERELGTLDAARRASEVRELAGILFHV